MTRNYKLMTRNYKLMTRNYKLMTRNYKLMTRNHNFEVLNGGLFDYFLNHFALLAYKKFYYVLRFTEPVEIISFY